MADPYHRYAAPPERGSVANSNFPGYLSSEAPSLLSNHTFAPTDLRSYSSDFRLRDKSSWSVPYGVDDSVGSRVRSDSGVGVTAGSSLYDPLEDTYRNQRQDIAMRSMTPGVYGVDAVSVSVRGEPGLAVIAGAGFPSPLQAQTLLNQRHATGVGIGSSVSTDISRERSVPSRSGDGLPVLKGESNILFVDGLPTDCTRREVGHLFRPFIGFKEIKVVHKEPRRSGDKAMVLCFVEFVDPKCALTAMEALQGYKFDDKKPDSLPLRIHFAHFPFRLPSDSDQKRSGIRH
ncbi:putative nucleotide-binding alpha-beta plait domain-containing protein [Rosa chinensis]|uniref:Putative nucleotide-binding alpha-beta plait domain-containing protein n=1 Tax=Rosa chinensis TaxID=74649 RepID=A0A2P6Q1B9_ROSCH|nr:putative nucleotide-binding alpha-beta plait domain-containing protein [Rosa chinensis]